MKHVTIMVVALVSTAAVPALACDKDQQASFPMPAAAFQEKVDGKAAKIRARIENRLKQSGATAEQAKQERARVEAILANIQTEATKAITAEEAKTVKAAGRGLRHHKKDGASKS